MSRVITFSRVFPKHHPRAGEQTHFVEKILTSMRETVYFKPNVPTYFYPDPDDLWNTNKKLENRVWWDFRNSIISYPDKFEPKHHTIRAGKRWKVGDKFSPRVWSGKPYASKQIIIAADIEIKKIWDFEIKDCEVIVGGFLYNGKTTELIKNDGFSQEMDFWQWIQFPKPFSGQIICWSDKIEY